MPRNDKEKRRRTKNEEEIIGTKKTNIEWFFFCCWRSKEEKRQMQTTAETSSVSIFSLPPLSLLSQNEPIIGWLNQIKKYSAKYLIICLVIVFHEIGNVDLDGTVTKDKILVLLVSLSQFPIIIFYLLLMALFQCFYVSLILASSKCGCFDAFQSSYSMPFVPICLNEWMKCTYYDVMMCILYQ